MKGPIVYSLSTSIPTSIYHELHFFFPPFLFLSVMIPWCAREYVRILVAIWSRAVLDLRLRHSRWKCQLHDSPELSLGHGHSTSLAFGSSRAFHTTSTLSARLGQTCHEAIRHRSQPPKACAAIEQYAASSTATVRTHMTTTALLKSLRINGTATIDEDQGVGTPGKVQSESV